MSTSSSSNPILVIFYPILYIFGALFSLLQIQVIFSLIAKGVSAAKKISALEPIVPREFTAPIFLDTVPPPDDILALSGTVLAGINEHIVKVFG